MNKKWKLAGAGLLLAVAIPASAYAADGFGSKVPEKDGVTSNEESTSVKSKQERGLEVKSDLLGLAAKLGLDEAAYEQAIKDGKSFADIASEKGIALQPLIDGQTENMLASFADKQLSDEEMGNVRNKVAMEAKRIFLTPLNEQQNKDEGPERKGFEMKLDFPGLAAKLGLDDAAYEQAIKDGKSLADIAKEKGIALQPLIDEQTEKLFASFDVDRFTEEEQVNVRKKVAMESERIFTRPLIEQQKVEAANTK